MHKIWFNLQCVVCNVIDFQDCFNVESTKVSCFIIGLKKCIVPQQFCSSIVISMTSDFVFENGDWIRIRTQKKLGTITYPKVQLYLMIQSPLRLIKSKLLEFVVFSNIPYMYSLKGAPCFPTSSSKSNSTHPSLKYQFCQGTHYKPKLLSNCCILAPHDAHRNEVIYKPWVWHATINLECPCSRKIWICTTLLSYAFLMQICMCFFVQFCWVNFSGWIETYKIKENSIQH